MAVRTADIIKFVIRQKRKKEFDQNFDIAFLCCTAVDVLQRILLNISAEQARLFRELWLIFILTVLSSCSLQLCAT